jgi:hypothetical protein
VTQLKAIFNLGHKLGELARQVEMVIETQSWRRCQNEIKVSRISDSLLFVLGELMILDGSGVIEKTQQDIKSYLEKLTKEKIDEGAEKDGDEDEKERKLIVGKLKSEIKKRRQTQIRRKRQKRKLTLDEVNELNMNLGIWKDRLVNECARLSKK